jgi:hypothetical protein
MIPNPMDIHMLGHEFISSFPFLLLQSIRKNSIITKINCNSKLYQTGAQQFFLY